MKLEMDFSSRAGCREAAGRLPRASSNLSTAAGRLPRAAGRLPAGGTMLPASERGGRTETATPRRHKAEKWLENLRNEIRDCFDAFKAEYHSL